MYVISHYISTACGFVQQVCVLTTWLMNLFAICIHIADLGPYDFSKQTELSHKNRIYCVMLNIINITETQRHASETYGLNQLH